MIYIINILLKHGLIVGISLLMRKTCQKLGLAGELISAYLLHDYSLFSKSIHGFTVG